MRNSLFIAPLLAALLPELVLYTALLSAPRHIPIPALKMPVVEPAGERGFYYLHGAGRFVPASDRVLP